MATEPDEIRTQIEETRAELADDVDRLADRTSPRRVVRRGMDRVENRARNLRETVRDKVMGAPDAMSQPLREGGQALREAPQAAAEHARGNPLAAGLIAFGAGLLAAALIPTSQAERRAGQALADSDLAGQLREPLAESASQVREDVTGRVGEAGKEVAGTAKEAAQQTAAEAKDTAQRARQ